VQNVRARFYGGNPIDITGPVAYYHGMNDYLKCHRTGNCTESLPPYIPWDRFPNAFDFWMPRRDLEFYVDFNRNSPHSNCTQSLALEVSLELSIEMSLENGNDEHRACTDYYTLGSTDAGIVAFLDLQMHHASKDPIMRYEVLWFTRLVYCDMPLGYLHSDPCDPSLYSAKSAIIRSLQNLIDYSAPHWVFSMIPLWAIAGSRSLGLAHDQGSHWADMDAVSNTEHKLIKK
tara:strand:+ start:786 stop:1478 length:693 start_codon:yes stop_codon:yes gene_type:complete